MNKDRAAGIGFVIFGLAALVLTTKIPVPVNLTEPGPRLFPYIATIGIIICGIGMALEKCKKQKVFLDKAGWRRLGSISLALVLYYLALDFLGFVISTPFAAIAFIYILGQGKKISKVISVILSIGVTAILYYLFEKAFGIFLPSGIFF